MKLDPSLTLSQAIELGLHHHQSGDIIQAEKIYRQILRHDPENAEALHFLGLIDYQRGNLEKAEKNIRRAIRGQNEAATYYNSLGVILQAMGRLAEAFDSFIKALELDPHLAESYSNLGNVYRLQNRLVESVNSYEKALKLQPELADAHSGLGKVHMEMRDHAAAQQCFERALTLSPQSVDAHNGMGMLLVQQHKHAEAARYFQIAIDLDPSYADAHNNLGGALIRLGRLAEAIDSFRRALNINPHHVDARINLGNAYVEQNKYDEALAEYEKELKRNSGSVSARIALASALQDQGRLEEALKHYRYLNKSQGGVSLRLKKAYLLPVIPDSMKEILESRTLLEEEISKLEAEGTVLTDPLKDIDRTSFYISYQGLSNRKLLSKIALFYEKACPSLLWTAPHCQNRLSNTGKIRIGFISRFMHNHSIGKTTRGLVAHLDKNLFEIFTLFVPPMVDDDVSKFIRNHSDQSIELPFSLEAARMTIANLKLDILFYQDIGQETFTYFLAFSRLAPIQCVSFGHPDTTGIRNMDYWVTNDRFETENFADEYTEKAFLLRDLGTLAYYYRPERPSVMKDRAAYALPDNAHIYLCPQTLFKLHPEFDEILGGILRADPQGRVVLIESKIRHWVTLLSKRFQRTIPDVFNRIIFIPRQRESDFRGLIANADVMLDTIHFNGMNTSLEGFNLGVPIVTLPTSMHRGRHTYGMYTKTQISDCIANSPEEYVKIAVRIATDADYREDLRQRILSANHVLFEDLRVVREFERFFLEAVQNAR